MENVPCATSTTTTSTSTATTTATQAPRVSEGGEEDQSGNEGKYQTWGLPCHGRAHSDASLLGCSPQSTRELSGSLREGLQLQ
mmetsp:Transcript_69632/g.112239  ORF Transcript_69632/g.112239 Transcript_69632/m.112239 type:complete len:83 (-) Transcript_69632:1017-1265(-)